MPVSGRAPGPQAAWASAAGRTSPSRTSAPRARPRPPPRRGRTAPRRGGAGRAYGGQRCGRPCPLQRRSQPEITPSRPTVCSNSLHQVGDHLGDRSDLVHPADDLPDRHRDRVGVVPGVHPVVGVGDQQVLQRHRQRRRARPRPPMPRSTWSSAGAPACRCRSGCAPCRPEPARRNASRMPTPAERSYSSAVSQIDPVHTPWAPSASEAATWRPRADAAGAEHGHVGADGVDDLGGEHHRGDLTGVAAGLVALGHDDVDAVRDVGQGVLGRHRPAPRP